MRDMEIGNELLFRSGKVQGADPSPAVYDELLNAAIEIQGSHSVIIVNASIDPVPAYLQTAMIDQGACIDETVVDLHQNSFGDAYTHIADCHVLREDKQWKKRQYGQPFFHLSC